ncbi:MAG: hypothetical protein KDB84_08080 [Flavobacteriales bacterium]|nr:hypothetical protein [Flavobacteriales bacterium]
MRRTYRSLITLWHAAVWCACSAQDNPMRTPAYPFLDLDANAMITAGDQRTWNGLLSKMDRLMFDGRGQLSIVHIGGSHVQADMWTMELRHRLQTVVPGVRAARGFIFPFNMARTNNPYWYHPEYTGRWTSVKNTVRNDASELGLAGYSVTTTDTLSELKVSFRGEAYDGYVFDRVKVLHAMDSSFAVEAWSTDTDAVITKRTDRLRGFTEFTYDALTDTLRLRFVRTDSTQKHFTLYGILLETDDPGFVYHAIGVNGASTSSYLRCQRFSEDLALLRPDLVVFSIGINDAHDTEFDAQRFKENYRQLIDNARKADPDVAVLLTTNTDSYLKRRTPNPNASRVRDVMRELSAEKGCAVWDTFGVMGGLGSIARWQDAGMAQRDRIHLTRAGYTVLGDLLFSALMTNYGDHVRATYQP